MSDDPTTQSQASGPDIANIERAQRAIALITVFAGIREHGPAQVAAVVSSILADEPHPDYLISALAALGATLAADLAEVTGTTAHDHLQALGRAAAMLRD